ncbi:MAG: winged helix-turn-helix domain-containing protein [Butyricicoccaceae bacterium]
MKEQYSFNDLLRSDPKVRLCAGTDRFFGPGTRDLLEGIRRTGSVQQSCAEMGLSYSKGRHMIRHMEAALQTTLVERTRGGAGGGSARLTPAGAYLLDRFTAYEASVRKYAEQQLPRFFPTDRTTNEVENGG